MNTVYFIAIVSVIALVGFVYTFLKDPDDTDPKWNIDNAPWRK
jgi:hypothetical protein